MEQPYLSIIFSGRNDNYGGDFNKRLQLTVNWFSFWVEHFQLNAELIIVNYNPIVDQPGLDQIIQWPENRKFLYIRLLTIPPEIHAQYIDTEIRKTVPLFEFIAKNLAIPRAKGKFIVCTNADILFSPKLMEFLAKKNLDKDKIYRCDRFDFVLDQNIKMPSSPEEFYNFESELRNGSFKFFLHGGTYELHKPKNLNLRLKILNFYHRLRVIFYTVILTLPGMSFIHKILKINYSYLFFFKFHCNAAGDFTLMSKENWLELKGYPEDTWISTHVDSLMILNGGFAGKEIKIVPFPVFHQHHQRRYNFQESNPDMDKMLERLLSSYDKMVTSGRPILNEHENWGQESLNFEDIQL